MKKIIILLLIVLACTLPPPADAGTCVASKAGNWSDVTVWGTSCNGSTNAVPVANDDVQLAGYVITWDIGTVPVIPATGSLGTITTTGTAGQISIALDDAACHGNEVCKITATAITAGTKPTNAGVIYITGSGSISDHILGVHANVTGGSNTSSYGVHNGSTGKVRITGTVNGGSSTSCNGLHNATTGTFEVQGAVTGGSGTTSVGVYNVSTGTGTVTGDVTGGSGTGANGVYSGGAGSITFTGNLINGTGGVAWGGKPPVWTPGNTYYTQWYDTGAGAAKSFYVDTDPGVANVKSGTTYYFQSGTQKTGTYSSGGGGAWSF